MPAKLPFQRVCDIKHNKENGSRRILLAVGPNPVGREIPYFWQKTYISHVLHGLFWGEVY